MSEPKKKTASQLRTEVKDLNEALVRLKADAANLHRQTARLQAQVKSQTKKETLLNLLPLIDNLERAFTQPPKDIVNHNWVKGVLGLKQQLASILTNLGVSRLQVVGQVFDPVTMEALEVAADPNHPPETVLAEIQAGYIYQDQVLRVAQVKVSQ